MTTQSAIATRCEFVVGSKPFERARSVSRSSNNETHCGGLVALRGDQGIHRIGDVIEGTYKVVGQIGTGGQSEVYEAQVLRDVESSGLKEGETVALKVLSLKRMDDWQVSTNAHSFSDIPIRAIRHTTYPYDIRADTTQVVAAAPIMN